MPQEIFDVATALLEDEIEPLFRFKFGSIEFDIFPSSALEGEQSFNYVHSQLYAAAIAQEYNELNERSKKLMDGKNNELTREIAQEYGELLKQMQEKTVELDNYTVTYIESLAKMNKGDFIKQIVPELDKYNSDNNTCITLSKLVSSLYTRIQQSLETITVESEEEKDAKLYNQDADMGKLQEIQPETNTETTVNGSLKPSSTSSKDLELVKPKR